MEIIVYLMIFIIGASIGSFLNVLIDRLPNNESINGRSHCDYCGKKIKWFDLTPIFSYFFLGGKTRCCHKKLSFQYPMIEMITGTLFILIFNFKFLIINQFLNLNNYILNQNFQLQISNLLLIWGIASCLIVIFVSDFKYHLISDYILLALLIFSFVFHLSGNLTMEQWNNYLISALIVSSPIWLVYFISKERAMGLGDVYLAGVMGFLLGWKEGLLALYIAFITGAIFGLTLIMIKNKKIKSKIAFGPFLVIGTTIMLFFSNNIFSIMKNIYGF